ncbi:stimulator of interferon genes -like [Paramuricea clavata]|uniref:Stimulator of interferon genes -like n=1 Tax=Paramuricea clavata TaxID=317549 RepID=A0A6S7J473_PARCT|nr:stimulator of interferon genes -like [Paramuricea clavata]
MFPESVSKQNAVTGFEPLPEKRKNRARCVSIVICVFTTTLVIAFSTVDRTMDEYYPDTTQKNTTDVCYRKWKSDKFDLLATALGLFSIVLGVLVDRLTLIAEERHHLHQRYDGSCEKMIKACFSGISWGLVIALLGLAAIIVVIRIITTGMPRFELRYLVYICSGIGVGPLIMHLLSLNTKSEVHISTILEEKGMFVANGLAWSYYFNYLQQALPKFNETINCSFPVPYEHIRLSLDKLLLLIPLDGYVKGDLKEVDGKIEKLFDTGNEQDPFHFPVYRLTLSDREHKYFAMQYVKEPLNILREVSTLPEQENAVLKRQPCIKNEVKLLYRMLYGILKDQVDQNFRGTCILVPIGSSDGLENGGLVRLIMNRVQHSCTQVKSAPVFVRQKDDARLFVGESRSSTFIVENAQTLKIGGLTHQVNINGEQQRKGTRSDSETTNGHDNERNDKKEKGGKILRVRYKNKKSEIELQVMILSENLEHREPEVKPFAQEEPAKGNQQSCQDEYSSNEELYVLDI